MEALRSSEGANIPTDIEMEELGETNYETLTLTPTGTGPKRQHGQRILNTDYNQISWFDMFDRKVEDAETGETDKSNDAKPTQSVIDTSSVNTSNENNSRNIEEQRQEVKNLNLKKHCRYRDTYV